VTRVAAIEKCVVCGGLLVPPELVPGMNVAPGADYICATCGRPFDWIGTPPQLVLRQVDARHDDGKTDARN